MKIKIVENEYQPPFRELDDEEMDEVWVMDAGNNYVKVESVIAALNELASLRAENEAFREDHHKHDEWMAWAQSYFNDNPDLCMWGSRLDVGIRETLIMRDQELAQLRAERDALKARVEELENTIDCGCNALTDSICCSGNDADTNLGFVRKMKRVLIGNNPTTPGGDE